MAVTNDTIFQKMLHELHLAKQKQLNQAEMQKHIENIRLLCDLFLTDEKHEPSSAQTEEISAAELKAMLGEKKTASFSSQPAFKRTIELDENEGNGESLFDF